MTVAPVAVSTASVRSREPSFTAITGTCERARRITSPTNASALYAGISATIRLRSDTRLTSFSTPHADHDEPDARKDGGGADERRNRVAIALRYRRAQRPDLDRIAPARIRESAEHERENADADENEPQDANGSLRFKDCARKCNLDSSCRLRKSRNDWSRCHILERQARGAEWTGGWRPQLVLVSGDRFDRNAVLGEVLGA